MVNVGLNRDARSEDRVNARMPQEMPKIAPVRLNGGPISATEVEDVAIRWRSVTIEAAAFANLEQGRRIVDAALSDGQSHYGINTGFGNFANVVIPAENLCDLQENLIRSHAAGVGPLLSTHLTRML